MIILPWDLNNNKKAKQPVLNGGDPLRFSKV